MQRPLAVGVVLLDSDHFSQSDHMCTGSRLCLQGGTADKRVCPIIRVASVANSNVVIRS
jgi:hypothetical protein